MMEDSKNIAGRPKGTPKTGGRKKGTPNKTTKAVKTFLTDLIASNKNQIKKDLKTVEPKDRLLILEKFMQYVVPKQQAIKTDVSLLSDDELSDVASNILDKIKENENDD